MGKTTQQVREVTGYCCTWIRELVSRYNREGPDTIKILVLVPDGMMNAKRS